MIEHFQLKRLAVEIYYTAEMDEFWSFACTLRSTRVSKKSNQRWTWYAIDKFSGIILAWHNGGRTDADFLKRDYTEMQHEKSKSTDATHDQNFYW